MRFFCLAVMLTVIATASVAPSHARADTTSCAGRLAGVVSKVDPAGTSITVTLPSPLNDKVLVIADSKATAPVAHAQPGDLISFDADDTANSTRLTCLGAIKRQTPVIPRLLVLAFSLALICGIAAVMTWGSPLEFMVGADNRYSNSQTQLALWFTAVAAVYLAAVLLRWCYLGADYIGGVGITENVMALTGLSALSFGGAKVITTQKIRNATQPNQPAPKPPAAQPHLLTDLVQNDSGQADLGDFEMILVTLAAVGIFAVSAFHFLGALALDTSVMLPDVDSTLLASFGIGHGAYLVKKAALKLGDG